MEASSGNFPLPMSNNCVDNTSTDSSFSRATRLFVDNLRVLTYVRKVDDFKQALILSAAVGNGTTGSIRRKSLARKIDYKLRKIYRIFNSKYNTLKLPTRWKFISENYQVRIHHAYTDKKKQNNTHHKAQKRFTQKSKKISNYGILYNCSAFFQPNVFFRRKSYFFEAG